MSYQLVLKTAGGSGSRGAVGNQKDIGENVFVNDLPGQYPCYAFYYPGPMPEPELEAALRKLGGQTGHNLFVNIGRLDDPAYGKIAGLFEIKRTPAIVLTATAPLAALEGGNFSAYVLLDSENLLASTEHTMRCVNEVFTLFLRGEVAKAINTAKSKQRAALLLTLGGWVRSALGSVLEFIADRDISISVFEGRFELKRSGE